MQFPNRTIILGILNITPNSFSDGGLYIDIENAISYAKSMIKNGVDIIDVGGESTHPNSLPINSKEELKRIIPIIKELIKLNIPISIDTYKPEVAKKCLEIGANIINDISGLNDIEMAKVVSNYKVPIIIMYNKNILPNKNIKSNDIISELKDFFSKKIKLAESFGIKEIIIDPGIGFGKTLEENIEILRNLGKLKKFNKPILIGTSRKGFLGKITGLPVSERLESSLASNIISIMNGANIIRVHDIRESKIASTTVDKIIAPH